MTSDRDEWLASLSPRDRAEVLEAERGDSMWIVGIFAATCAVYAALIAMWWWLL